jgi:hypothetical protein
MPGCANLANGTAADGDEGKGGGPTAVCSSSIMVTSRPVAVGVILASLKNLREQIIHFSHVVFTMKVVVVN